MVFHIFWTFFNSDDDYKLTFRVFINFSESCKNIEIRTTEKGKIFSLWYGESDANLTIYHKYLALMLNGNVELDINNTFIYLLNEIFHGFKIVKIVKPNGEIEKLMYFSRYGLNYKWIAGIGEKGKYKFTISYLDRIAPDIFGINFFASWLYPWPLYFVGLDVTLPFL